MVNTELLNATLAYIEEHPEEWDQRTWRCETTACFAGHAAMLAGWTWRDEGGSYSYMERDGEVLEAPDAATKALDISDSDADRLFEAENTLADLRRIVAEYNEKETP